MHTQKILKILWAARFASQKATTAVISKCAFRRDRRGITALDAAKAVSPSLAKRAAVMALDGEFTDLADPIERGAKIEFISRKDPCALELIRQNRAHVMAEALKVFWSSTPIIIGPAIENRFYYDFFRNAPAKWFLILLIGQSRGVGSRCA